MSVWLGKVAAIFLGDTPAATRNQSNSVVGGSTAKWLEQWEAGDLGSFAGLATALPCVTSLPPPTFCLPDPSSRKEISDARTVPNAMLTSLLHSKRLV